MTICLHAIHVHGQEKWNLKIICTDKGNEAPKELLRISDEFSDSASIYQFLKKRFIKNLWENGYLAASIDSVVSEKQLMNIFLFLGDRYAWGSLNWDEKLINPSVLQLKKIVPQRGKYLSPSSFTELSDLVLDRMEEIGYPFATIQIDSSSWKENQLFARLKLDPGPLYHIDSVHVDTRVRINPEFLRKYLGMGENQLYQKSLLTSVSKRIEELGFVREFKPWDLSLYGTGSRLNLYLASQKNNRFDFIAGLMPSNPQLKGKTQLTGEGNMELFNTFGNGEYLMMNWQQLQIQSPRLQVLFQRPFVFKTRMGFDVNFNLLKKDSSYLNLFTKIGFVYQLDPKQFFRLHIMQHVSNVLKVDTLWVKRFKQLPSFYDFTHTQLNLEWNRYGTDNRKNPMRGLDWSYRVSTGVKKIKKQSEYVSLKYDAEGKLYDFNQLYRSIPLSTVQSNMQLMMDKYCKTGGQSTIKFGLKAGWLYGKQLFLNELYQIGGIKTLRGFDEESIFASSYAIGTTEFRYLLDQGSNFFGFIDGALVQRRTIEKSVNSNFIGLGAGIRMLTKSGTFSLVYAVGRSNNQPFSLQRSKIHIGFTTFF